MQMLDMSWNAITPRGTVRPGWAATPRWLPVLVSALAVVALLAAYVVAVRQVAASGESRRVAVAAHSDAVWRCYTLRGTGERKACVQELASTEVGLALPDVLVASP